MDCISIFLFWFYQLKNNFEIDPEAVEKILIRREDFYHALEHDIKPVSKASFLFPAESKGKSSNVIGFLTQQVMQG